MNQEQWDELKRLHFKILERVSPASVSISHEQFSFLLAAEKALPKILAEREAAQRLRDVADEARSWMTMPKAEGTLKPTLENVGANQRRIVAELQTALATFDKESKND